MKIKRYGIISTIFIIFLGTILHFTYNWSNNNSIVGAFSAVNESTWEHLKLLFFPTLLTAIIGYIFFRKSFPNILCGKVYEILTSMLFTVTLYYTYTGVLGKDIAVINILIFILAVTVGEFMNYQVVNSGLKCNKIAATVVLIVFAILFVLFTYNAPEIGLFKDPITGGYGIIETLE